MMELADVLDSKSSGSDTVRVRPPLPAPDKSTKPRLGASFNLRGGNYYEAYVSRYGGGGMYKNSRK